MMSALGFWWINSWLLVMTVNVQRLQELQKLMTDLDNKEEENKFVKICHAAF